MKAPRFPSLKKAPRLGLKEGWGDLGTEEGWGITVTLIRDDGVALREQPYRRIFPPARGPGPTLSQRSAWPLAPRLLPHTMSSHMLERLCPKEQIKSTPPRHPLPLFSPSFCTLHKRSMRPRTYPGIFRRVLIAPLGEGGGGPPGRRLASTLLSLCFGSR